MKLFSLLVSAIFVIGCTPNKIVHLSSLDKQETSNSSLMVYIRDKDYRVDCDEIKLNKVFGNGNNTEQILVFYKTESLNQIKNNTKIGTVFFSDDSVNIPFDVETKELVRRGCGIYGNYKIAIALPASGTKIMLDRNQPDYVLILDRVNIKTAKVYNSTGTGASYATKKLFFISDFVLWDNINGTAISYGHVDKSASILFGDTSLYPWKSACKSYIQKIFDKTPFKKAVVTTTNEGNEGNEE